MIEQCQIDKLKQFIDEQLRIRCINVTTTLELVADRRGNLTKLKLSSTKFNTVPVIHGEIEVVDFGSSITENTRYVVINEETVPEIKKIEETIAFIRVYVSYVGNRESLFNVSMHIYKDMGGFIELC